MHTKQLELAQAAALRHPVEAVKVLGVTTDTIPQELSVIFTRAYKDINVGFGENDICKTAICNAVEMWRSARRIPEWLAAACVKASNNG
jgi:hypothetical protein